MIPPPYQHRFKGDSGVDVASYAIDVRFPGKKKRSVLLRLGAPFEKKKNQWWIRTELENLDLTEGPIAGEGSLHTLILGIRWMILRLEVFERAHKCRYFWAGTKQRFDYHSVLATYEAPNQSSQPTPRKRRD